MQAALLTPHCSSGSLPASWAEPAAFPALTRLDLSGSYINGTLPSSWTGGGGFQELAVL